MLRLACDPAPESGVQCALVGTVVTLTATASKGKFTIEEKSSLRKTIIQGVAESIGDGTFEDKLP